MKPNPTLIKQWSERATAAFAGKTVALIRYTTEKENREVMWNRSGPVIVFTDGSWISAMCDDEGNAAGALATSSDNIVTIPVI